MVPGIQHSVVPGIQHSGVPGVQHSGVPGVQHSGVPGIQHPGGYGDAVAAVLLAWADSLLAALLGEGHRQGVGHEAGLGGDEGEHLDHMTEKHPFLLNVLFQQCSNYFHQGAFLRDLGQSSPSSYYPRFSGF